MSVFARCFALFFAFMTQLAWASVWVSDDSSLYRLDLTGNQLSEPLSQPGAIGLAVDPRDDSLWVLTDKEIIKRTSSGEVLFSLEIKTLNLETARFLALDPRDGSLWVGEAKSAEQGSAGNFLRLSVDGVVMGSLTSPGSVRGVMAGLDQSVWMLGDKRLVRYSSEGVKLADIDLKPLVQGEPKLLSVDSIDIWVWVAAESRLIRIDAANPNAVPVTLLLPKAADSLALDTQLGKLWVLANKELMAFDDSGAKKESISLFDFGISGARSIVFDPASRSLLVAHATGVTQFLADGGTPQHFHIANGVSKIGVTPFEILTELHLISPVPFTFINDSTPELIFQLITSCSSNPCEFSADFYSRYLLSVEIHGQQFGPQFQIDPSTSLARYQLGSALPEGLNTLNASATDLFGRKSNMVSAEFTVDTIPPSFIKLSPVSGAVTNQASVTITGTLSEQSDLIIGSDQIDVDQIGFFASTIVLSEGANTVQLQAIDPAGNQTSQSLLLTLDTAPPTPISNGAVSITATGTMVLMQGVPGSAEPFARVTIKNSRTGESVEVIADSTGYFTAQIGGLPGDQFNVVVIDAAGNTSAPTMLGLPGGTGVIPPDPASVAPPLDKTVATVLSSATAFLYSGPNPIQTGIAAGVIEPKRAAVIRGRVLARDNTPLPGVQITIQGHPEFGQTLSRADGMFDMAVNGGGVLAINYTKAEYLPIQRQVNVPWQDYVIAPEAILIKLDAQVTPIAMNSAAVQVARGSVSSDDDGVRRATLVIPAGTTATMTLPNGTIQSLTTLKVRATEYTVGENGPKAMPAPLPPTSGYTYAVELSADEAIAANARTVTFNQPVYNYVENFLNFPVGIIVPNGYYDRDKAAWVPGPNGKVIKVLGIDGGMAVLDTNGDGMADDATQLAALNIDDAERSQLATLYAAGQSLWRVPIPHFTPWDHNWPFGPPADATPPKQPDPQQEKPEDKPCEKSGSIIECQNQVLGERIGIAGTPFTLNYRSDRVPGRKTANTLNIPLSGATIPARIKGIEVVVDVAGRQFAQRFDALANQSLGFSWDGLDAYGRLVNGVAQATIRVGYVYDGVYQQTDRFGYSGNGVKITGSRTRQEVTLWQESLLPMSAFDARTQGLGGWSLDIHHAYNPSGQVLYQGDGAKRRSTNVSAVISTLVGGFKEAMSVAIDAQGNLFVAEASGYRVRKVGTDGIITTVAGNGIRGYSGDGGPATAASLGPPEDIAVDAQGNLFIADWENHRVRKVGLDGIISTIAGNGVDGDLGDGSPATEASLSYVSDIAVDSYGDLYIGSKYRVRKVGQDGIITTVAGSGKSGHSGDGGPATSAKFDYVSGLAVDAQGNLFIAAAGNSPYIRKVSPNGIITTVAGCGEGCPLKDGVPATSSGFDIPIALAVDGRGELYIADVGYQNDGRIRKVGQDGIITTVAGGGLSGADGGPATAARLSSGPLGVAVDVQGNLFITTDFSRLRKITGSFPTFNNIDIVIASQNGSELYGFDAKGRHLETVDAHTGVVRYAFAYDTSGYLITITDGDGNVTNIERDSSGKPIAIRAPDGQRTQLSLDANDYLASVANPAGETFAMSYTDDGLLTTFVNPRGHTSHITYDSMGRLLKDQNAVGGYWSIGRTNFANGSESSMTSALGRTNTYRVEELPSGDRQWRNTGPNGTLTQTVFKADGTSIVTAADGTVTTTMEGPDPRFGMQVPITSSRITRMPSGLTQTFTSTRSAVINSTILISQTDTATINGKTLKDVYTASTRQHVLTSPAGRQVKATVDAQGRPTLYQLTSLASLVYGYDSRGRLTTITQGAGADARYTLLSYNPQGYVSSVTDPAGRTESFAYDAAGRVIRQTMTDGRVVQFAYDANGNVASITPAGRPQHAFAYTPVDLEERYTPPMLSGVADPKTQYAYNLDKQLTSIARPDGQVVNLAYDTGGRLQGFVMPGRTINFEYNASTGQLARIAPNNGLEISLGYDGFLPVSETLSGPVSGTITRTYNNDFNLSGLTVNGTLIPFAYDKDGLLTQAGSLAFTRNAQNGLITGTTLGGIATSQGYTTFGEVSQYSAAQGGASALDIQYAYDKLGRITQKTEALFGEPAVTTGYVYDPAGRLAQVRKDGIVQASYAFDANGNRTSLTTLAGTTSATYDAQDRLLSYGGASYTYTANGELKTKTQAGQTTTYAYDALGNLTQVSLPSGTVIDYLIDGANRRVGMKLNGQLVQGFLYQDSLKPVAELDGSGNIVSRFVYGTRPNVPEYMQKGADTYRILTDHLGSVRLVIHADTGQVAQRMEYDEYGNVVSDTHPGFQPFGFAGGLYDPRTRLVRFGARDYDAETGRWTAKDPIRFGGGDTNLYGYVLNDPVNFKDPDGRIYLQVITGAVGAGLGAYNAYKNGGNVLTGALIGGASGILSGGALLNGVIGVLGNLAEQANKPCPGLDFSEAIAAGLLNAAGIRDRLPQISQPNLVAPLSQQIAHEAAAEAVAQRSADGMAELAGKAF